MEYQLKKNKTTLIVDRVNSAQNIMASGAGCGLDNATTLWRLYNAFQRYNHLPCPTIQAIISCKKWQTKSGNIMGM